MKRYYRSIAIVLMLAVMFCMGPATSVLAAGGTDISLAAAGTDSALSAGGSPLTGGGRLMGGKSKDQTDGSASGVEKNQVIVLY